MGGGGRLSLLQETLFTQGRRQFSQGRMAVFEFLRLAFGEGSVLCSCQRLAEIGKQAGGFLVRIGRALAHELLRFAHGFIRIRRQVLQPRRSAFGGGCGFAADCSF